MVKKGKSTNWLEWQPGPFFWICLAVGGVLVKLLIDEAFRRYYQFQENGITGPVKTVTDSAEE